MIKSMTAYAAHETGNERFTVSLEIRTYNSRFFDAAIRLPRPYASLEERVRQTLASRISRGRVEINILIQDKQEPAGSFDVNEDLADAFHDALLRIKNRYNLPDGPLLSYFIQKNGIIEHAVAQADPEAAWPTLFEAITSAVDELDAMRVNEGKAIAEDLKKRIRKIAGDVSEIETKTKNMLPVHYARLKEKIIALTEEAPQIDPARIAQEAAILADKSDISEEIVRAKSHLRQFEEIMNRDRPAGKPLNFLLQELNREFTTMGSKAGDADIAHIIVSVKTELEKIREQVQNIE